MDPGEDYSSMRSSYAVGVDVGGTRIAVGLVERKGRVVKDAKRLTPKTGPFAVVDTIIDLVEEVSAGAHQSEIAGIGIGVPAQVDFLRQSVEFCTNLPLAGVDVRSLVMSRSKLDVAMDNDGHMAALGEARYGAGGAVTLLSDPDDEAEETIVKAQAFLRATNATLEGWQ